MKAVNFNLCSLVVSSKVKLLGKLLIMAVNSGGEVPESSSNCDQQEVAIMQLEKLRLSTSLDESVGFSTSDESKGEKNEIYHSARSDNTDGSVKSR